MLEYNNGKAIDVDRIEETEYERCAKEWGEGNKYLEDLILFCLNNGINTWASCSGHDGKKYPYISFELNKNNREIIDVIGTELKNIKNMRMIYTSKNSNQEKSFVTFELPIKDISVFCGIKRICKDVLEGKVKKTDKTVVMAREIIERLPESENGSYIVFSKGLKKEESNIKNYNEQDPTELEEGNLIKIYTESGLFKKTLNQSGVFNYSEENKHFYGLENDDSIQNVFKNAIDRMDRHFTISDSSLEAIAKRKKDISVSAFYNTLKQRIKTYIGHDQTKDFVK